MCKKQMSRIYPECNGLQIIPSASADKELSKFGLLLSEIAIVLEQGFDCSRRKRKKDIVEKCIRKGRKQLKAVVVKSYNYTLETECWLLIYIGIF